MRGGFPTPTPANRMPRWLVALLTILLFTLAWAALSGIGAVMDASVKKREAVVDAATQALEWGKEMERRVEALEQALALLEQPKISVNIVKTEVVCHYGRRARAVYYTGEEQEGWFIVPLQQAWNKHHGYVVAQDCEGDEGIHPKDREKVLEELDAKG